jgi:hypothetical protein
MVSLFLLTWLDKPVRVPRDNPTELCQAHPKVADMRCPANEKPDLGPYIVAVVFWIVQW